MMSICFHKAPGHNIELLLVSHLKLYAWLINVATRTYKTKISPLAIGNTQVQMYPKRLACQWLSGFSARAPAHTIAGLSGFLCVMHRRRSRAAFDHDLLLWCRVTGASQVNRTDKELEACQAPGPHYLSIFKRKCIVEEGVMSITSPTSTTTSRGSTRTPSLLWGAGKLLTEFFRKAVPDGQLPPVQLLSSPTENSPKKINRER